MLLRHSLRMPKKARPFLERMKEAYADKYRDRPTQVKLAALVGKAQPTVSDWGKPGKYPELETVIEIAVKLGVSVEWLLSERGPKFVPPVDKDAQALWELWPRLGEIARTKLVAYAETWVAEGDGSGSSAGANL